MRKKNTMWLLMLFSILIYSCHNKQKDDVDVEAKYQQTWERALENQDFATIEELIAKNRRFKILSESYDFNINIDTLSKPLECLFYWSLNKNVEYARDLSGLLYNLKRENANIMFWENKEDNMSRVQMDNIIDYGNSFEQRKDTTKIKKVLAERLQMRDNLQIEIRQVKKQGEENLKLIKFALDKSCKLDYFSASSIIFGRGNDFQWNGNEVSLVYYFDKIAPNPEYFEPDEEYYDPTLTLANLLSSMFISSDIIKYLYNKGIDKKKFFEIIYPIFEEGERNDFPLTYENEKILFELMPDDMQKLSGYTLLHSAIVNLCVSDVEELATKNRNLLNIKTNLKRNFIDSPENKAFTPLELARYKQKEIEKYLKEFSSDGKPDFTYSLLLQQIKKIVSFLEKETRIPPKHREWSTLID